MIDKGSYYIYIPNNCTNYTDAVIYYPGADGARGSGYDSSAIENYASKNPDQILIVNKKCSENTNAIYGALKELQNSRGFKIRNVNILSHSAGQSSAFDTAVQGANNGLNVKYVGVLDSAFKLKNLNVSENEAKALAASGATAVFYDQDDYGRTHYLGNLINAGVPIVYIKCNTGSGDWGYNHKTINEVPVKNGLIPLMSGEISSMSSNGGIVGYEYWTYDYEHNGWVRISKEQAEKLLSDSDYITQALSGITNIINGSSLENILTINLPHNSNTKSPSINKETYDLLATSISNLCAKAKAEINAFITAGERYDELDHMLSNKASELTSAFMNNPQASKEDIPQLDAEVSAKLKEYEPREIPKYDANTMYLKKLTESTMELTAADINRLFSKWAKDRDNPDSPLLGTGELFVKAAAVAGIDVLALVALCGKETNYGSNDSMNEMNNNNFFGNLLNSDSEYSTKEEGIMAAAKGLRDTYIGNNTTARDLDDTVGTSGNYGQEVATIMKESLDYIVESDPREHIEPKDESTEEEESNKKSTKNESNSQSSSTQSTYSGPSQSGSPSDTSSLSSTSTNTQNQPTETSEDNEEEKKTSSSNKDSSEEIDEPTTDSTPSEEVPEPINNETPANNEVSYPAQASAPATTTYYQEPANAETIPDNTKELDNKNDYKPDENTVYNDNDDSYRDPFTDDYDNFFKTKDTTENSPVTDTMTTTIETENTTTDTTTTKKRGNPALAAIGAITAAGAAAGAVAYNIKRSQENNEISEDDEELEISDTE